MKMTKEVKEFAKREFNNKVSEMREKARIPAKEKEKKIFEEAKEVAGKINDLINDFYNKYSSDEKVKIDFYDTYNDERKNGRYARFSVSVASEKIDFPDEVRFMAELSMGESLDSITELLNKYFA